MTDRERDVVDALRTLAGRGGTEPPAGAWQEVVAAAGAERRARRTRQLAAAAIVVLVAGAGTVALWWGGDAMDLATTPSSSTTTTATTTTDTTTTDTTTEATPDPLVGRTLPSELMACAGDDSYRTLTDWLPGVVPTGLSLDWAHTTVNRIDPAAAGPQGSTFTLAEITADRLGDVVRLRRSDPAGFELDPSAQAGFSSDDEGIDSVRGLPGRIVRTVNRGDPIGVLSARWIEAGAAWSAWSIEMTPEALAAALAPLDLDAELPSDPTGRFQLVGRSGPQPEAESRETTIEFTSARTGLPAAPLKIVVRSVPPGAEGLLELPPAFGTTGEVPPGFEDVPVPDGWRTLDVDGRQLWRNGPAVRSSLADGSQLEISALIELTDEQLVQLIQGLERVSSDDPRLVDLPVVPAYWEGTDGLCRE